MHKWFLQIFPLLFMHGCATDDGVLRQLQEAIDQSPKFSNKLIGPENYILFRIGKLIGTAKSELHQKRILEITLAQVVKIAQKEDSWTGEDAEIFQDELSKIFHELPEQIICNRLSLRDSETIKLCQILKVMIEGRTSIPGLEKILSNTPSAMFPAFL